MRFLTGKQITHSIFPGTQAGDKVRAGDIADFAPSGAVVLAPVDVSGVVISARSCKDNALAQLGNRINAAARFNSHHLELQL